MSSNLSFLSRMASYFLPFETSPWTLFFTPAIVLGIFLTWRIWRFSLAPIYSPNEPEQLPYWIPCTFAVYLTNAERKDSNENQFWATP